VTVGMHRMSAGRRSQGALSHLVALLVLGAHLWLPAFVFASPPDPIDTTGGYFDDGDYDDVVLLVMAMHAVVRPTLSVEPPPTTASTSDPLVHPMGPSFDPGRPHSIRAPPTT
jgi:hypothetical protein